MSDRFGAMTDREILVSVAADLATIKDAVFGAGRLGIVETVAIHGEQLRAISADVKHVAPLYDDVATLKTQMAERTQPMAQRDASIFGAVAGFIGAIVANAIGNKIGIHW